MKFLSHLQIVVLSNEDLTCVADFRKIDEDGQRVCDDFLRRDKTRQRGSVELQVTKSRGAKTDEVDLLAFNETSVVSEELDGETQRGVVQEDFH